MWQNDLNLVNTGRQHNDNTYWIHFIFVVWIPILINMDALSSLWYAIWETSGRSFGLNMNGECISGLKRYGDQIYWYLQHLRQQFNEHCVDVDVNVDAKQYIWMFQWIFFLSELRLPQKHKHKENIDHFD